MTYRTKEVLAHLLHLVEYDEDKQAVVYLAQPGAPGDIAGKRVRLVDTDGTGRMTAVIPEAEVHMALLDLIFALRTWDWPKGHAIQLDTARPLHAVGNLVDD